MPLCEVVMRLLISLEMIKCVIRDLTSLLTVEYYSSSRMLNIGYKLTKAMSTMGGKLILHCKNKQTKKTL